MQWLPRRQSQRLSLCQIGVRFEDIQSSCNTANMLLCVLSSLAIRPKDVVRAGTERDTLRIQGEGIQEHQRDGVDKAAAD